ncbi:MAG: pentapeptide repeat-containing protein, partial [Dolichospermum sp.]
AKKLDFARPGETILANLAVLNLLVTLNGRNKSYIGANLKGANLIGADLKEANLKNADIIEATFQGAVLEWANLTLTQAVGTNFTKAQMTGACVEAWNIESTTILDDVDCRFVYLLEYPKPRTDDRERRPSSGEFQPGEFTKLFEEVLNTVDLIFRNGID